MNRYDQLQLSVENGVATIKLNNTAKKNALGWTLHHEIIAALNDCMEDSAVACVLFIGDEEIFCGGWDLDVLSSADDQTLHEFNELALKFMTAVYDFGKPTIAAVAGVAPGYGMDLANMCDVAVASENAFFGSTQVKYAMNGFYGGLQRKCGPMRARKLYFTGDAIPASEAYRIGMVDDIVPVGSLKKSAVEIAMRIARNGTEMGVALKRIALRTQNMDHLGGLAFELQLTSDLLKRGLFKEKISLGYKRLKEGSSVATENLENSNNKPLT